MEEPTTVLQHGIVGPEATERNPLRERVAAEEKAFLKKGSTRRGGTYTARETGAQGLAVRHFEEFVKNVRKEETRRKAKKMI
jgi:hypothetical protein